MGFEFTADEVFRIGERIEVNGERFYRAAAKAVGNGPLRARLEDLAGQEHEHQARFRHLREQLGPGAAGKTAFDPDEETALYLDATAATHVFGRELDPDSFSLGAQSPREILSRALQFEKDSIVFFLGMKGFVPATRGGDKIDWLVQEEMKHIRLLSAWMREC
jgi:rubrerythrin